MEHRGGPPFNTPTRPWQESAECRAYLVPHSEASLGEKNALNIIITSVPPVETFALMGLLNLGCITRKEGTRKTFLWLRALGCHMPTRCVLRNAPSGYDYSGGGRKTVVFQEDTRGRLFCKHALQATAHFTLERAAWAFLASFPPSSLCWEVL